MTYIDALGALADPTRRRLFDRLCRRPHAVGELTKYLGVSQPAVSQHLRVLRAAKLVRSRSVGSKRMYQPNPVGIAAIRQYLDAMWTDVLDAYADSFDKSAK